MAGPYIEVEIVTDPAVVEPLLGLLSQLGFEGFWEDGGSLRCYVTASRWESGLEQEVESVVRLATPVGSTAAPRLTVRMVEHQNWNAEWERTIKPIRVTDRIIIAPTWQEITPGQQDILIRIDPKMSFGTGYHESTRLALKLLQRHVRGRPAVLDVGTGTGVLAIAAVKLGAHTALGVDIDEWSYANAVENIALNGVQDAVTLHHGDLEAVPGREFNVVVCNIQRTIIERMLGGLVARLAHRGVLILSGLLVADREPIITSLRNVGLRMTEEIRENDWLAITACR